MEAACGTAALSRQIAPFGYTKISAFDNSRPMLAEAFRLSANFPTISLFESDINSLDLSSKVSAIIWMDYSSNFALDESQLSEMIIRLLDNICSGGYLLFDVRTFQGWQVDFYSQPITTFATERFQRIWLNHQDRENQLINFDVFVRTRDVDGAWSEWNRESMTEKMWHLSDVVSVVENISDVSIEGIYRDDFKKIDSNKEEPNLAYFVIKKK